MNTDYLVQCVVIVRESSAKCGWVIMGSTQFMMSDTKSRFKQDSHGSKFCASDSDFFLFSVKWYIN